jgi:hypothetical protein
LDEDGQRRRLRAAEAAPVRARALVMLMLFKAMLVGDDTALARLASLGHAHINPFGRYRFDNADGQWADRLRPLHRPDADEQRSRPSSPIGVSGDRH